MSCAQDSCHHGRSSGPTGNASVGPPLHRVSSIASIVLCLIPEPCREAVTGESQGAFSVSDDPLSFSSAGA